MKILKLEHKVKVLVAFCYMNSLVQNKSISDQTLRVRLSRVPSLRHQPAPESKVHTACKRNHAGETANISFTL